MTTSWVIVERATNKPVMETYELKTANHVRSYMPNYQVMPIMEYLQSLNGGK